MPSFWRTLTKPPASPWTGRSGTRSSWEMATWSKFLVSGRRSLVHQSCLEIFLSFHQDSRVTVKISCTEMFVHLYFCWQRL
jgi:hypothetical protein